MIEITDDERRKYPKFYPTKEQEEAFDELSVGDDILLEFPRKNKKFKARVWDIGGHPAIKTYGARTFGLDENGVPDKKKYDVLPVELLNKTWKFTKLPKMQVAHSKNS